MLPAAIGEVRERRGVVWDRRAPDPPSRRSLGFDKAGLAETPGQPGRVRLRFFRSGASILLRGSTLLTAAMKEMQDSETARLFSPIKQSLLATLKSLTPHLEKINEGWQALLQGLSLNEEQNKALHDFDFRGACRSLKSSRFDDYRLQLETYGRELERLGLSAENVTCVVAFYLVTCLRHTAPAGAKEKNMIVAMTRLMVASHRLLFSGYGDQLAMVYRRIDEQERHKLSRDLHDDVGHNLVVLKLYMEMISKDLTQGDSDEQIKPKVEEAKALIANTIESVRRLILDLGPALLEETGLVSAIRLYSRQFSARTGIKATIQDAGVPDTVPSSHEIALYRVFQGALSNVVKHSRAQNVKVVVGGAKQSKVIMIIEDDGVGFDLTSEKQTGFGLRAMRERIEGLGGRFYMESWPAKFGHKRRGTRIEIDLPVPTPEAI